MIFQRTHVLLLGLLPVLCGAFSANPKTGNPLSSVLDRLPFRSVEDNDALNGTAVLEKLEMASSIEPKRFSASPQQWPSVLAASFPVRTGFYFFSSFPRR